MMMQQAEGRVEKVLVIRYLDSAAGIYLNKRATLCTTRPVY